MRPAKHLNAFAINIIKEESKTKVFFSYNILSYDEELLRHFLFRNLQYSYLTTVKDTRRLDLYPAFQYLHFVRPGIMLLGRNSAGGPNWRLSDVMHAKGMRSDDAHNAEADTLMTAELLKLYARGAPDIFEQIVELSDKRNVADLLGRNMMGQDFILMFTHFGMPEAIPIAPVAKIEQSGSGVCPEPITQGLRQRKIGSR